MRAFIGNTEIELPPNFKFPLEKFSPIYDDSLRIGDLSMGIEFPATPKNRIVFGFVDELHQAAKTIAYENFRIEQDGYQPIYGTLRITGTKTDQSGTGGSITTNFYTNLIPLINQPLHAIMTKTVNLGSTPAAIIASAKAQTVANPSTDGITGSVLKFVPTYAPDFYGDKNKDWELDADEYSMESEYEPNDHITFRLPEFTQDHPGVPDDIPYANIPKVWRNIIAASDRQTPFSRPDKWQLHAPQVMNSMKEGDYFINNNYEVETGTINRHALLPSIQVLDVFREIAKALGYTIKGQFMDDGLAQRIFLFSNMALDKQSDNPNYAYVGSDIATNVWYTPLFTAQYVPVFNLRDGIYENNSNRFVDTPSEDTYILPIHNAYVTTQSGLHYLRVKALIKSNNTYVEESRAIITELKPFALPALTNRIDSIKGMAYKTVILEGLFELEAGEEYYPCFYTNDADGNFDVLSCVFEVKNVLTDFVNIYEGNVNYADHMPDCTGADFIHAFQLWKNLYQGFDPLNKVWRIDFTDSIIKQNADMIELKPWQIPGQKIETKAKRRFELNYGNVDEVYEKPANVTELDAVAAVQDLPPPTQPDVCILVRNLHAYYVTKEYDYGGRLFWDFAGYAWYDLKVEAEGDLYDIRPDLGPVPMGRFQAADTYETIGPIYNDAGRSPMYLPGGKRPGIQVMHYLGMQTDLDSQGVPFATVSGYDYFGTKIVQSYAWAEQYPLSWKRTLQMIVLEEIITAHYHFPPEVRQLVQFSKLFLLGHVPVIPIRTARQIDARSSSAGQMEIEARKVKMVEIQIVSNVAEEPEGDNRFQQLKGVKFDGAQNFLQVHDFNFNSTSIGYTHLIALKFDTALLEDFAYYYSSIVGQTEIIGTLGTKNFSLQGLVVSTSNIQTVLYLAQTYDPGTNIKRAYFQGIEVANNASGGIDYSSNTHSIFFARAAGGSTATNKAPGKMIWAQVIKGVLTPDQIAEWSSNYPIKPPILEGSQQNQLELDFSSILLDGSFPYFNDRSFFARKAYLNNFTANQLNSAHPDYCLIPYDSF